MQDNGYSQLDFTQPSINKSQLLNTNKSKRKTSSKGTKEKRGSSNKKDVKYTKFNSGRRASDFAHSLYKKGKLMPAGMSAYDPKSKKMKRSNSKHNQSKESKFSSRRLSSNHEEMQVQLGVGRDFKPQINNLVSDSQKASPKKNFNSTASHPSQASYKKLTDVQNSNKMNLDQMLEKSKGSKKVSRSQAAKQHNTSGQAKDDS